MFHAARIAARSLIRKPGFTALAVGTIALAAGANAAVFAVAYGVLLKPLPFAAPDRLVAVWPGRFMSQVDLRYLREHADGLDHIAAVAPGWTFSLTGAGDPSKITVDRVSGNLFETLGAAPLLGRAIRPEEEQPGAPKVIALSYRYWQSRFGGDRSVIGRVVKLDDVPHEIVAVMPPAFEVLTTRADAWAPLPADRAAFYDRLNFSLLVGRISTGLSVEAADRRFQAVIPAMRAELSYPESFGRTARQQDLRAAVTGDMRTSLLVLGAAVTFMLLIAGANVGTLLVARASARAREFAVHAAIGASRGAVIRLQLFEAMLLALAGASLGLVGASWATPALVRWLPRDSPRTGDIAIDATIAFAVVCAAVLVAVVFAAAPAFGAGRPGSVTLLREGGSTESRGARRMRGSMVTVQIALALVLTIGAGLMLQSLARLQRVDAGIDVDRILTLRLQPTSARYKAPDAINAYYDAVLARLEGLPGVRAAGAIQHLPFSGIGWVNAYEVEGEAVAAGGSRPSADYKIIVGRYFDAVGQPLLAGRDFSADDRAANPVPVIVNDSFARRHFGSAAAAVGRRIRTGRSVEWQTIVGVAGDVRTKALNAAPAVELYTPATGTGMPAMMIAVRTHYDPLTLAGAAREAVWSVDRTVPVADLQPMRTMVGTTLTQPRLLLTLLGAFAVSGLALGAIGVYGVVAFAVTRRRREIGLRMALGATPASVVRMMLRESAGYAAAGLIAGTAGAFVSSRALRGLLFEVRPTDALTYATLACGVAALVALASYWPARRAASVDPAESLRAS